MIAILFSWLVIFVVCSSFGHICISAYNSFGKQIEKYNWLDVSLIGMCVVSLTVSVISLFCPIDEVAFFILSGIALVYLLINRPLRNGLLRSITNLWKRLSAFEVAIGLSLIVFLILISIWAPDDYDPAYYHYQNIAWNERFSVVPGLANIEDRFGFNSNMLLLYALFSLKFLFADYIFAFQSFFALLLLLWILSEISRNRGNLCRIVILFVFLVFIISSPSAISNTSTDVLPNLVAFYLIARIFIYPDSLRSSYLLYILLPVTMLTFKVSSVFLCILSLYLFGMLLKNKEYKRFIAFLLMSACIIAPWLVRNVIISGYLIYPMFEIDLFSFDWKVPIETAENQRKYMAIVANERHWFRLLKTIKVIFTKGEFDFTKDYFLHAIIHVFTAVCALISLITLLVKLVKRQRIQTHICLIGAIIACTLLYWFFSARDYRFVYGVLLSVILFCSFILFPNYKLNKSVAYVVLSIITIVSLVFSVNWSRQYYMQIEKYEKYPFGRMLYTPYLISDKLRNFDYSKLEPYHINENTVIYISRYYGGCSYTILPTVAVFESDSKAQDIKTVEMRGDSLQEGFSTKSNSN